MAQDDPTDGDVADVIPLPLSRAAAAGVIVREHDRLVEMLMVTIDLLDDVQAGGVPRIDVPKLRTAAARKFRSALEARTAALAALLADDEGDH